MSKSQQQKPLNIGEIKALILQGEAQDAAKKAFLAINYSNSEHKTTIEKRKEILTELCASGADLTNFTDPNHYNHTPLHLAAQHGWAKLMKSCRLRGADVNAACTMGYTALHLASSKGHGAVVTLLLLDHLATAEPKTNAGNTPFDLAHNDEIRTLLTHGAAKQAFLNIEHILSHNKTTDEKKKEILMALCASGANLKHFHDPYNNNITPLHLAAQHGWTELVEPCITLGASVNATCLSIFSDIDASNRDHNLTPMHVASKGGYAAIVTLLLDNKASIDLRTTSNETPYFLASNAETATILLERKAEPKVLDEYYRPPLFYTSDPALAELQIKAWPESVHKCDINKETPLFNAAEHNHAAVIKTQLTHHATVNATNQFGATPLHRSALKHSVEAAALLLQGGANINQPDNTGWTAAHYAALETRNVDNAKKMFKLLLDNGANIKQKTTKDDGDIPKGSTMLDIAKKRLVDPALIELVAALEVHYELKLHPLPPPHPRPPSYNVQLKTMEPYQPLKRPIDDHSFLRQQNSGASR